jgi:glycosyltransferase involved in cell wall biosynthesis
VTVRVAYLTSRFPKLTETFIANEAAAVRDAGVDVRMYAYVAEDVAVRHPSAAALVDTACYPRRRRVLQDQIHWITTEPRRYATAWWRAIAGNIASPRFLLRALAVVPIAASFARTMQDDEVDHVHAHYATHSALGAYVVHVLTGLPYSFTAHAHDIQVDRTMLAEKVRAAKFVAVVSEFNANLIGDEVGDDARRHVHVVRCGVDTTRFRARKAVARNAFVIAIVASLERRKGHRVLLEAVRRLVDDGERIEVDVVGDGPDADQVDRDIADLELTDHVRRHGGLPAPDVVEVLRSADAFVLPSLTETSGKMEGIPVALMEAMAVGLPVVATRMSGIPELVIDGETGVLISEGSVDELTHSLVSLIRSPALRERLGGAGRAHVQREFDERLNVDRLLALFEAPAAALDRAGDPRRVRPPVRGERDRPDTRSTAATEFPDEFPDVDAREASGRRPRQESDGAALATTEEASS